MGCRQERIFIPTACISDSDERKRTGFNKERIEGASLVLIHHLGLFTKRSVLRWTVSLMKLLCREEPKGFFMSKTRESDDNSYILLYLYITYNT